LALLPQSSTAAAAVVLEPADDEEGAMRRQLREMDAAMCAMMESRAVLVTHLNAVEVASRAAVVAQATATAAAVAAKARKKAAVAEAHARAEAMVRQHEADEATRQMVQSRGSAYCFYLDDDDASSDFSKRCGTAPNFASVKHVVFFGGGDGFFVSRDDGNSHWAGLPSLLADRLVTEQRNHVGELLYVAGGPHGEYYAELKGSTWWSADMVDSERFDSLVHDQSRIVSRIAFGHDSWVIVFADGVTSWCGIPERMVNEISHNASHPTEVSLGANETFYIRFANGSSDYSLPIACADHCDEVVARGFTVTNVILSPGGNNIWESSWLVRYS